MRRQPGIRHQQGAVLLVALIFLVVLTVAGVTAMRFATIEERMASNVQFRNQAFQSALSELRYQLLALNQNLANRAPLLVAREKGLFSALGATHPDRQANPDLLKIHPDSTLERSPLPNKMNNNIQERWVRSTTEPGPCEGSGQDFVCQDFEISAIATLPGGANSSQAMGINFINNASN